MHGMSDEVRIGQPPRVPPIRRRAAVVAVVALAVAAVIAVGVAAWLIGAQAQPTAEAPQPQPTTRTIAGQLQLGRGDFMWYSSTRTCAGRGGFGDIREGTQVVVTDEAGTTIALGRLRDSSPYVEAGVGITCTFHFAIHDVPSGKKFYGVEISHRGRVQYTEDQLGAPLRLNLG